MQIIRDRGFYKMLALLALPIALQDLIKFGLNLMDNIMVGALSEVELSAVTLANQPFFLFSMLTFGLAGGGTVLISQYYGKGDIASVRKVISITLGITAIFTVLIGTSVLLFPEFFMRIYTPELDVIASGVEYLRIMGWTYFLFGISNVFILVLRSVQVVKITLFANATGFILNVFLNWVFIYGNLGAPALGVSGAALATLIARIIESLIVIWYVRFKDKKIKFRFRSLLHPSRTLSRDFFKYSSPVVVNELAWGMGTSMISVILGRLGKNVVAASSISATVQQLTSVVVFGIASASCILIGKEIGAGNKEFAKKCAHTVLLIAMCFGLVFATLLFFLRGPITSLYNIAEQTRGLALDFLTIASIAVFIDSVSAIGIVGILRGGGDTRFSMCVDVLTLWLFSVPLGAILGLVLGLDPVIVYAALRSDVIIKSAFCLYRILSNKWVHDVTRPLANLEENA